MVQFIQSLIVIDGKSILHIAIDASANVHRFYDWKHCWTDVFLIAHCIYYELPKPLLFNTWIISTYLLMIHEIIIKINILKLATLVLIYISLEFTRLEYK